MKTIEHILAFNQAFVDRKEYEAFQTDKFPDKRLVIVSCMDTRLTELLPRAMDLRNGDAKIIKNAGAIITHPFGSVMRSIIVAVYELGAEEICIIAHHGCGMNSINPEVTVERMIARGVGEDTIRTLESAGIDLKQWLHGFDRVEDAVQASAGIIRNHPLLPSGVPVHGMVMDPETGKLDLIIDGYETLQKVQERPSPPPTGYVIKD